MRTVGLDAFRVCDLEFRNVVGRCLGDRRLGVRGIGQETPEDKGRKDGERQVFDARGGLHG
ncbi:hypothetical protein D9M68_1005950 [compost metagenome]